VAGGKEGKGTNALVLTTSTGRSKRKGGGKDPWPIRSPKKKREGNSETIPSKSSKGEKGKGGGPFDSALLFFVEEAGRNELSFIPELSRESSLFGTWKKKGKGSLYLILCLCRSAKKEGGSKRLF